MSRSAARAGPWHRSVAFIADVFIVSVIVSLVGIWLAGVTGGSIRAKQAIGSRIRCTVGETTLVEFTLPPNTKVDRLERCTKEFLGIPHDWWLIVRARTEDIDGSSVAVITVPLDPMGHTTDALYLDSLVILVFGIYAFMAEWRFGATVGKRLRGIRVRSLGGAPVDAVRAAKRGMMRMAAFIPSTIATACAAGSTTFAWWLFEHPASKIIGGVISALWCVAFAANFLVATARRALPWHDRFAGTEAITQQNERELRVTRDLPARSSPLPSWLVRGQDKR
jgi:uncharacterized RDD family membrane protein YckC